MRIVIDMQGAQTESRFRGIGRYALSLALAIARNAGHHDVLLALSGRFPETIEPIRAAFRGVLPRENIRVWQAPGPLRWVGFDNEARRAVAERVREAFLATLAPDVVIVTSLFEGMGDDAIISIGALGEAPPTAVILYDLIPLINPDVNFRTNPVYRGYYANRIENLRRAGHLLAISDSARKEALGGLGWAPERVTNILGACDALFKPTVPDQDELSALRSRLGLTKPFIMYTGGADERKNLPRLIEAFSQLPSETRESHQLLFVGRMPPPEVEKLKAHASRHELQETDLIFTDFISDSELLAFFNTCDLFVFPSIHEGFGLPPLEAMACGAVVIAADSTSLPEVMGSPEALFDPTSVSSISAKMHEALTDQDLRARLRDNARTQAQAFSWDRSAKLALQALTTAFDKGDVSPPRSNVSLQYTSLFEPEITRILLLKLDHMGDLLLAIPAISRLRARYPKAKIDIAVGSWNEAIARTLPFFDQVLTLDYFKQKSSSQAGLASGSLDTFLKRLGGYDLAIDLRRQPDTRFILTQVDAPRKVGYSTLDPGVDAKLTIVLPTQQDLPFVETELNRTSISRQMLALIDALPSHPSDYVSLPPLVAAPPPRIVGSVALFPYAGGDAKEWPADRYLDLARKLASDPAVANVSVYFASEAEAQRLSFAGIDNVEVLAGLSIPELMQSLASHRLCVANNSGGAHLAAYLGVTVLGVYGGHETVAEWAPVFGESYVLHQDATCSPCHIPAQRDCPHQFFCLADIAVEDVYARCGELLASDGRLDLANRSKGSVPSARRDLLQALAPWIRHYDQTELAELAQSIALTLPGRKRQSLFVDVSELVNHDARTGIQRVVRSTLSELLKSPPRNFDIVPVYAKPDTRGYFYARTFLDGFSNRPNVTARSDDLIDFQNGDVFIGLDLNLVIAVYQKPVLDEMHQFGVRIYFAVYDLLPIIMPDKFIDETFDKYNNWIDAISRYDGVLCGSQTVARDFEEWLLANRPERRDAIQIGRLYYGADVQDSRPSLGMPGDASLVLETLRKAPSFLMVGTVEPRKGHAQALEAFEQLWQDGAAVNLVVVGKRGWMVDDLVERLQTHPEQGRRLFWLNGISDEYLDRIYAACDCLLVPSQGEGFGLPLIEAALKGLPVLARDLPVFREVAQGHAHYFKAENGAELADAVTQWLSLHRQDAHPRSDGMPTLTWQTAVRQMLDEVLPERSPSPPRAPADSHH